MAMEVSAPRRPTSAPGGGRKRLHRTAVLGDMACDILLGDSSHLYRGSMRRGGHQHQLGGAFEE